MVKDLKDGMSKMNTLEVITKKWVGRQGWNNLSINNNNHNWVTHIQYIKSYGFIILKKEKASL